jgi:hypothetical protein
MILFRRGLDLIARPAALLLFKGTVVLFRALLLKGLLLAFNSMQHCSLAAHLCIHLEKEKEKGRPYYPFTQSKINFLVIYYTKTASGPVILPYFAPRSPQLTTHV